MSRLLIPNTTQIPNVLLDEVMPHLTGSALKVMLAIVRKTYGFQKRSDKISFNSLQKLTGLSREGVNQGIKALGPLLIITPGRKNVPTLDGVNEYALNLNIETGKLVRKANQSANLTSQNNPQEPVQKSDSSKPNISKPNKTGAKAPESSSIKRSRKPIPPEPATLAGFDRFYSLYPRHVGRTPALAAWLKVNPNAALTDKIIEAARHYTEGTKDTEQRYILHPATWLNQERWTDELINKSSEQDDPNWRKETFING